MPVDRELLLSKLESYKGEDFAELLYSTPALPGARKDDSYRIVIIESEKAMLRLGENNRARDVEVRQKSVVFGLPGGPTGISSESQDAATLAVVFFPDFIRVASYEFHKETSLNQLTFFHTPPPLPAAGKAALSAVGQMAHLPGELRQCGIHMIYGVLRMVMSMMKSDTPPAPAGKSLHSWRKIEKYISENISRDLSRAEVAGVFRMNPSYLSTLCSKCTGKSYNEHVRRQRLSQAAMLMELNLSIDEVAERCGFNYTTYFIRAFKKEFGVSPGKYRLNQYSK